MTGHNKRVEVARKWKKLAAIGRKKISFNRTKAEGCDSRTLAGEGCFVIYSVDMRRFVVPLACLSSHVFQKLLEISEEEYGISSDGPIIMPHDSALLQNVVTLIGRGELMTSEKVLPDAVSSNRSLFSLSCAEATIHQLAVPVCLLID